MRKLIKGILWLILSVLFPAAVYAGTGEDMSKLLGVQLGKETTLCDVEQNKNEVIDDFGCDRLDCCLGEHSVATNLLRLFRRYYDDSRPQPDE